VIQFLRGKEDFGLSIAVSDETGELLNTGGGLMKAAWFFNDGEPFLLHNVDVLSDIDFSDMENALRQGSSLATLAVAQRESSRYFLFDGNSRLAGWENIKTGERIVHSEDSHLEPLAFSGVHLISPEIFSLVQRKGKFSMVEVYLALCAEHKITAYRHDPDSWLDMGKPGDLEKAGALLRKLNLPTL
jgi:NDP-sugar pyrophosphorylase family protein